MKFHMMALVSAVALLAGCPAGTGSDTDTDLVDTDPSVTDDLSVSVSWDVGESDGSVTLTVTNLPDDALGFWWGLAETGPSETDPEGDDGWYGEDCLNGTGDTQLCHYFESSPASLDYVDSIGEVQEGSTTLLDGVLAGGDSGDRITYFLQVDNADGACFVWGDSPDYYSSEGCTVLSGI